MEMPIEFGKVWAMTRRDIARWSTYKTQAIVTILGGVLGIISWGLNSTYVNRPVAEYNTNYISFLIVGILISSLILPLQQGIQNRISPFTLETILMTGIRTPTFVLGIVMWPYILSVVLFIPQLVIAIVYFKAHLIINPLSFVLALVISSSIVFSLAMISTAFRIVTKTSDPITWGLNVAASILSGMTYPVQYLNNFLPGLSYLSWLIPQTWVYHIVRLATLTGASIFNPQVGVTYLTASLFGVVLLFLSYRIFRWGIRRAKREGSLGHF